MKNIVLLGFMGTGKTEVGKLLAKKLGLKFVDLDLLIEKDMGMSISDIFFNFGEDYFRELEKDLVRRISKEKSLVIATGGGVALNDENIENLRENGILITLKASVQDIFHRLKDKTDRPLLHTPYPEKTIREMLEMRRHRYELADFMVDTSNRSPEDITQEILDKIKNEI
jgi:shikimate kinase